MATVIQVKRGTASSWTSANTVLAAGEIGFESDTKKMKVGDGSTAWTSLAYTATDGDITAVVAGTGLSGGSTSGSATLSIDTAITVDKTTAQTLTNKTLTSPVLTTPSISTMTTTGDILYASAANTPARLGIGSTDQVLKVTGGLPVWATPASTTPAFIGCIAINSDHNTPFTSVGTEVAIPFAQTELVDTHNFHSTSSNPSRFTIPTGYDGKYLIQLNIGLASHNPDLYIYILKNGSKLVSADGLVNGQIVRQGNAYQQGDTFNVGLVVTGVAGDYFNWNIVVVSAGSGTNTIDRARCSFTYLGA